MVDAFPLVTLTVMGLPMTVEPLRIVNVSIPSLTVPPGLVTVAPRGALWLPVENVSETLAAVDVLVAALTVGLAGLAVAVWAHRRGHRLAGTVCCAITGLLVSPLSWTHHWVWAVPLLVWLTATAWRRRSVACGLAVAVGAAVFSGLLSIPWPGHPARPELMLASDQYVLYGLAVLIGTALALARERWPKLIARPGLAFWAALRGEAGRGGSG